MIMKSNQVQPREFKRVAFNLLAVGAQSMVTKICYNTGNTVPEHKHPKEQNGYVITGRYRVRLGFRRSASGGRQLLDPG
jgi:quercetin dioxygenase-like cupin family protein